MSSSAIALLSVQGVAFAIWAVAFFRALFGAQARARADTGRAYPGPLHFLRAMRSWIAEPANRVWVRLWLASLAVLVLSSLLIASGGLA